MSQWNECKSLCVIVYIPRLSTVAQSLCTVIRCCDKSLCRVWCDMPPCSTLTHIQSQVQTRMTYSLPLTRLSKPGKILSDCTVNTKVCMCNWFESYFTNSFSLKSQVWFFGFHFVFLWPFFWHDWLVSSCSGFNNAMRLATWLESHMRVMRMIAKNESSQKEKRLQPHPFFHPPGLCLTHFPFYLFFIPTLVSFYPWLVLGHFESYNSAHVLFTQIGDSDI